MANIRCVFFDKEIEPKRCLDMQLTGKAICKDCEDGRTVKEAFVKIKKSARNITPLPSASPLNLRGGKGELKEVKMKEKDYIHHKKCSNEGCKKYAVKDGMCLRHFNEAHGIEKRRGRKPTRGKDKDKGAGLISPESAGSIPAPATKTNGSLVSIDLSLFPKTYKFISALPEIPPEDMLEVLLKQRLNELEERIAI